MGVQFYHNMVFPYCWNSHFVLFEFFYSCFTILIGFIVMLVVMFIHMKWKVCPTCAIMDECHAAFKN